jgi:glycyl-tRNA synthetase beta subunit
VKHFSDQWYDKCSSLGLGETQATTLTTFINQLQSEVKEAKSVQASELPQLLNKSLKFFDDVVVREEIFNLNVQRVQLLDEVNKLEKTKSDLEKKAQRRTSIFFQTAFLLFTTQLGISFYCIY